MWSCLGAAFSSISRWELALFACVAAPKASGLHPNVVSYSSAMTACERASQWEMAFELFKEARDVGESNAYSLSSAIIASGQAQKWQVALDLFNNQHGLVVFNATLTALERATRWQLAGELLLKVSEADAVSYSAVAAACTRDSWQRGLWWLSRALEQGLKPGPGSFTLVARQMGHGRAWQEAICLALLAKNHLEVWCSVCWAMEVAGKQWQLPKSVHVVGRKELRRAERHGISTLGGLKSPFGKLIRIDVRPKSRQELLLWAFVARSAPCGDLDATLRAVRRFARRQWLKVAAGAKARLLQAALRPGDRVLERPGREFEVLSCEARLLRGLLRAALRPKAQVASLGEVMKWLRSLGGGGKVVTCEVDAVGLRGGKALVDGGECAGGSKAHCLGWCGS